MQMFLKAIVRHITFIILGQTIPLTSRILGKAIGEVMLNIQGSKSFGTADLLVELAA